MNLDKFIWEILENRKILGQGGELLWYGPGAEVPRRASNLHEARQSFVDRREVNTQKCQ